MRFSFFGLIQDVPTKPVSSPPGMARAGARTSGAGVPSVRATPTARPSERAIPTNAIRPEELPPWRAVRTAVDGDIKLSDADRRLAALLVTERAGNLIIHVDDAAAGRVVASLEARLRQGGERANICAVTSELLELVYDSNSHRVRIEIGGEEADEVKLTNEILASAIRAKASDLHLEIGPEHTKVKMRTHGDMRLLRRLSFGLGQRIARSLFVSAQTSSADFYPGEFQDAEIHREIDVDGDAMRVSLRFASMPVKNDAMDVTLRILNGTGGGRILPFESLGYDDAQIRAFDYMLSYSAGLILMCGATGSGKSTTLATCTEVLNHRFEGRKKIRSIENPPEYDLPARQTPVIQGDFARAFEATMRSDPDIIVVGEVRDEATARLTQDAAITGHLVLATTHSNTHFLAVDRLHRLGVDKHIMAAPSMLRGVIHQYLLPVLCEHCCQNYLQVKAKLAPDFLERMRAVSLPVDTIRFRGPGCPQCGETGVHGRTVCASFLIPDAMLRDGILKGDRVQNEIYWRTHQWEGSFKANGRTALDQALEKVNAGLISPLDVEAVIDRLDSQESVDSLRQVEAAVRSGLRVVS